MKPHTNKQKAIVSSKGYLNFLQLCQFKKVIFVLQVTVADFPMYELLDQHTRMKSDSLDAYPKLTAFLKRFRELPKVKEYLEQDCVKNLPINNKVAAFK